MKIRRITRLLALTALGAAASTATLAQTLGADFLADYSVSSLGSVPGLPTQYGGLTFLDNDTLLIGGAANTGSGSLYLIDVLRGSGNHITGFSGSSARFGGAAGTVGEFNDGGVVFGPGGVLFTSRWPVNGLGQTLAGSTDEDKVIDLGALGVAGSHAAINFVPGGFGGAGQAKLVSWAGGQWYAASLVPDGAGTFDLSGLTQVDLDLGAAGIQSVAGGPEGFVYIASGNASFSANSMLVSEYSAGTVGAYELDAQGNPLVATRRSFLSGLTGAEGATIDPLTGDFLFSTFGGANQVVVVSGFDVPPPPVSTPIPEPQTYALLAAGLGLLTVVVRRRGLAPPSR